MDSWVVMVSFEGFSELLIIIIIISSISFFPLFLYAFFLVLLFSFALCRFPFPFLFSNGIFPAAKVTGVGPIYSVSCFELKADCKRRRDVTCSFLLPPKFFILIKTAEGGGVADASPSPAIICPHLSPFLYDFPCFVYIFQPAILVDCQTLMSHYDGPSSIKSYTKRSNFGQRYCYRLKRLDLTLLQLNHVLMLDFMW